MSARRLNLWDSMWSQVVRAACGRSGVRGRRFVSIGLRVRQTPTLLMTRSKNTWTPARTWVTPSRLPTRFLTAHFLTGESNSSMFAHIAEQ